MKPVHMWCPTCQMDLDEVEAYRGNGLRVVCIRCLNEFDEPDQLNALYELGRVAGRKEVEDELGAIKDVLREYADAMDGLPGPQEGSSIDHIKRCMEADSAVMALAREIASEPQP